MPILLGVYIMSLNFITEALALYGASLTFEGYICKGDRITQVQPRISDNRIRFYSINNELLGSYPATVEGVCYFLENYYLWDKK